MRIIHVATYISLDGSFGGPIAVAAAQLEELARAGHEVELVAGWDGEAKFELAGVKVSLFKVITALPFGFSSLWAPGLLRYLRSRITTDSAVHIHAGRDLISLATAHMTRRVGVPYVLQTHGMIMPDTRILAKVLDFALTRAAIKGAHGVLALTDAEEAGLKRVVGKDLKVRRVANGIAMNTSGDGVSRSTNEVLFLARLHPRKRVLAFAEMARILSAKGIAARFVVVGPDEGDLASLRTFIVTHSLERVLSYEGPVAMAEARGRLAQAAVYVLPSRGEVFPMTILESLSVGTPVVTTHDSGIAAQLQHRSAALVTDGSPVELAAAVESVLGDRHVRGQLAENGAQAVADIFSISAVGKALVAAYQ